MPTDLPTSAKRYCDECRFFRPVPTGLTYARCGHEGAAAQTSDRFLSQKLDGEPDRAYCTSARTNTALCGEDAKWFEPKPAVVEAA